MKRRRQQEEDRLSQLPDKTLERILSSLGTAEAVRTSALSRRWRAAYAAVPVVDLVDPKQGHMHCCSNNANKACFDLQVTAAILGKSPGTPVRALRLDACRPPAGLLDQWVATAVTSGAEEIDVTLRYWHDDQRSLCPFGGSSKGASADFDKDLTDMYTKTPRHIFRCGTLRRLRLTNWTLDLPAAGVAMPSLETLCLARIMDPDKQLQELLSNCPRLADLTLQECPGVREITVTSPHLRSFAMICCHHASHVDIRSPCLQALRYKGALPGESLFEFANHGSILALTIEICADTCKKERAELIPVTTLISKCAKLAYLHLSLRPTMACHSGLLADALRGLPRLRQLGLQGCLYDCRTVRSVAVLLRETCNLEVLSLFLFHPKERRVRSSPSSYSSCCGSADNELPDEDVDSYDGGAACSSRVTDPLWDNMRRMQIRCFDHKLRRINVEKYGARPLERLLAEFLLSRAAALEEFSVTLTARHSRHRNASELKSWRSNRRTRVAVERWQEKL